ncbi:D-alanine--D-alanine ligase family protein [Stackebrandtia nassauensis]|uniref:D-alanine--D-alanine ligase n=1 Tax=Stackebrandtia nassauensis (strain DSM 44728 / CIP 108903 / NRRL B-16338 / NBRC 102104 / LLR-40K-21) TaxID=446470 RepID=D3Q9S9_STANL|nr:D-alanine--D-alanine ligase family protein [Stackebrandtia nassauensis]ADD44625.1 D-alanine/D-alanine ligase [Stackebrandtia nassauensis DSM 44728]
MKKTKVAVVLGGRSVEHPVSCASAAGVIAALDPEQYEVVAVGITQAGQWLSVDARSAKLALGDGNVPEISADSGQHVVLAADPTMKDVAITDAAGGARVLSDVDVVFPVLHGAYGEDGTIQGLLEMADVPYVGSNVLSSAASMDKDFMKRLLKAEGIPVGDYVVLKRDQTLSEAEKQRLGLPVFVKPSRAGSSLGISKVTDWDDLDKAIATARAVDPKVLVEAAFTGVRELECGVLEREDGGAPDTTPPFEVLIAGTEGWFDFEAKYLASGSPYDLAPDLPEGTAERIRELAARVFTVMDCSDLARVDFFLASDGTVYVNEINTMPGLTPGSGVPVAWANAGVDYPELVARLVRLAANRGTGLR